MIKFGRNEDYLVSQWCLGLHEIVSRNCFAVIMEFDQGFQGLGARASTIAPNRWLKSLAPINAKLRQSMANRTRVTSSSTISRSWIHEQLRRPTVISCAG